MGKSVPKAGGMELLWTNPDREKAFAAQKVSLDLSRWKFMIITTAYGSATLIPVGLSGRISASEGSSANPVSTRLFNSDSTGINFQQGLYAGGQGGWSDQAAVPYQIFGISI